MTSLPAQQSGVPSAIQDSVLLQATALPGQKFISGHIKLDDAVKPQLPRILSAMQDTGFLQAAMNVAAGHYTCSGQSLTVKGERRVDELQGRNSAEVERAACDSALQAVNDKRTGPYDALSFEGVGPARAEMLAKHMVDHGELQRENGQHGRYQLGVEGERRLDTLRGFDSAAIEQKAVGTILEVAIKDDGVCGYTPIDGIGVARSALIRKTLEAAGHLRAESISFRGFSMAGHKATVKGERALDTLHGCDSAAVEKAASLDILDRAQTNGGVHTYMSFPNIGHARVVMLFDRLQATGDLETATVRAGHVPLPGKRITEHGKATLGGAATSVLAHTEPTRHATQHVVSHTSTPPV